MRLIDADALADALFEKRKNYPQWVADTIGNMPTIDALALLKQEEVLPTRMHHSERASFDNYLCECKNELYYKQKFCDECGRLVKWK